MIILDTNVVSELMKAKADPAVIRWVDRQNRLNLWTTTVTLAEVRVGILRLPPGARRSALEAGFVQLFDVELRHRVLPFDRKATEATAEITLIRMRLGRGSGPADLQIAGIASVKGATVATRDIGGFDGVGLTLINPWDE